MALAKLPTELVENIANYLDLAAFRSLRLVSRPLKQQCVHHFRERFFRKRTVAWTVESFQTALDIMSHLHFGNALQDLVIDATPRHAIQLWKLRTEIPEDGEPFPGGEYQITRVQADDLARLWNETQYDRKALIRIFEKAKILHSITFLYEGMDRRYGKFCRRYCETSQNEMSRPFVSTMHAIVASGIWVQNIYTHRKKNYGAVSIGRLESLSPVLSKLDAALENLQSLSLNLRDWRHPEVGFPAQVGRVPFVVRFLSKCKSIRSLELSCYSSLEDDIFAEMAKHCKYPHLESCKLDLFRIYAMSDMFSFLAPSRQSLTSLSLNNIVLRDHTAEWPELMHRMASELDYLKSLELKSLFSRFGSRIGFLDTFVGTFTDFTRNSVIISGQSLKNELTELAGHLVIGSFGPAWHLAATAYPLIKVRS